MSIIRLLIVFIFLSARAFAQPGGGGGLYISNLYNGKLKKLDLDTDSTLFIRTFILLDGRIYQETFQYQNNLKRSKNKISGQKGQNIFFPPTSDIDGDRYSDDESSQRMLIVYQKDTMLIDFIGIIGENGAGYSDYMDSLVIQKGYFKFYRTKKNNDPDKYEYNNKNRELLRNGLTLYTVKNLSKDGYIEYKPKIDISFLKEENLPVSYFLERARYYLNNSRLADAFADITTGIEKNSGVKNCEILFLLTDYYSQTEQFEPAIESITLAIKCQRYSWEQSYEENYKVRIQLYIKAGKFNEALQDYNTIVEQANYKVTVKNERALFQIYTLKDYLNPIKDLTNLIDSIPESDLAVCNPNMAQYAQTYFVLGSAEYFSGQHKKAFQHWLKSVEWQYGTTSGIIAHFDSMLKIHPKVAELYLARGIILISNGPYLGWGKETRECFNSALIDIDKAENLGLKDYRVNLYSAIVHHQLKNYKTALEELNICIKKQSNFPIAYSMRYDIREDNGLAKYGDENDPDIVKYKAFCSKWRYGK